MYLLLDDIPYTTLFQVGSFCLPVCISLYFNSSFRCWQKLLRRVRTSKAICKSVKPAGQNEYHILPSAEDILHLSFRRRADWKRWIRRVKSEGRVHFAPCFKYEKSIYEYTCPWLFRLPTGVNSAFLSPSRRMEGVSSVSSGCHLIRGPTITQERNVLGVRLAYDYVQSCHSDPCRMFNSKT